MFCTSLRKRPQWSSISATLLASTQPRWKETLLDTYDLALPLLSSPRPQRQELFRFLLFSAMNLTSIEIAMSRVERLYHQEGGKNVGIVFLLNETDSNQDGTNAYMKLQISIQKAFTIPIIPLYAINKLASTLVAFQRNISSARTKVSLPDPARTLLPYCATALALPERAFHLLSDTCSSIPMLAQYATTLDGKAVLEDVLSECGVAAKSAIEFWQEEFYVG